MRELFKSMIETNKQSVATLTEAQELLADASVRQSDWRGDECGYLASQAMARIERGLKPTAEQAEAWFVCNTNEVQLFKGAI